MSDFRQRPAPETGILGIMIDDDARYRAVQSRDARFDGVFFTAVQSTGIYCRPSCGATTPKRENVQFYPTAAAAHQAGFRACKRCRPDAVPGSPEWNTRADGVGRAMRLIADGVVDRDGVGGLATRLGYSVRQVNRQLAEELGAGPLALARAQRTQTARILLETTDLSMMEAAFAAGFKSLRQFNETIQAVFALTPSEIRERSRTHQETPRREGGVIRLRLPYRPPLDFAALLRFLTYRAVPGVEECEGGAYRRVLSLPYSFGIVSLRMPDADLQEGRPNPTPHVLCDLQLKDLRDLGAAVQRCRRLLDLDCDPIGVSDVLSRDPHLAPRIAADPGRRLPGHVDAHELAIRAVLGQQISVPAARTLTGHLVARYGVPLPKASGSLTHLFPSVGNLASQESIDLPLPRARQRALKTMAEALQSGTVRLDAGVDREEAATRLLALPGIGEWTVSYIRMRGLSDPDAFMATDLGVRHALERLGLPGDPKSAVATAAAWRPWRAYALQYLWASLETPPKGANNAKEGAGSGEGRLSPEANASGRNQRAQGMPIP